MPLHAVPSRSSFHRLACLFALSSSLFATFARAEPEVIGVVACDGYADLRKQLAWLGGEVGNPTLVILAESLLTGVTGGRGLAGLDVKRPFGVVITADGNAVSGCGFLPVTDVDKLLGSLEGVIGPAEKDGGARKIAAPGLGGVRVVTKTGWAILAPELLPEAGLDDPSDWIPPLAEDYTLAVRLFPSRMPLPLREQLAKQIESAAARSAQLGQPVEADTLVAALGGIAEVESITIGLRLDEKKNRILFETRSVALPGSSAAKASADLGDSPLTVPLPKSATKPMVRGFVAQRIPAGSAESLAGWIDRMDAAKSSDDTTQLIVSAMKAVVGAAVESGRLDGSMAIVNAAEAGDPPRPEFTGGIHVKDGKAVERSLRKILGGDAKLPAMVKARLDDGRVKDATLHSLEIDLSNTDAAAKIGDKLTATVAIAPETCHLLVGGDAKARLAALLEQDPPAAQPSRPMAAVQLSADQWLAAAAADAKAAGAKEAERVAAAAKAAAEAESSIVQLQVRPIERGVAWQITVDSGVLKAAAAAAGVAGGGAGGLPIGVGPLGGAK